MLPHRPQECSLLLNWQCINLNVLTGIPEVWSNDGAGMDLLGRARASGQRASFLPSRMSFHRLPTEGMVVFLPPRSRLEVSPPPPHLY